MTKKRWSWCAITISLDTFYYARNESRMLYNKIVFKDAIHFDFSLIFAPRRHLRASIPPHKSQDKLLVSLKLKRETGS